MGAGDWVGLHEVSPSMADRTINITGGINIATSRILMKSALEHFGKVELINMGLQAKLNDPTQAPPIIKFATREGAEKALDAMNKGQLIVVGLTVRGAWKADVDRARGGPQKKSQPMTSRELMRESLLGPNRRRSRSRSRSYRGRGRNRRDDSRGRGRGRSPPQRNEPQRRHDSRDRAPANNFQNAPPPKPQALYRDWEDPAPPPSQPVQQPRNAGAPRPKGNFTTCANGHQLMEFTITDAAMEYVCDICDSAHTMRGYRMLCCTPCDYFVCQKCSDAYNGVLG